MLGNGAAQDERAALLANPFLLQNLDEVLVDFLCSYLPVERKFKFSRSNSPPFLYPFFARFTPSSNA